MIVVRFLLWSCCFFERERDVLFLCWDFLTSSSTYNHITSLITEKPGIIMFQPIKNKYISTPLIKLVCRCSACKDDKYIYEMKLDRIFNVNLPIGPNKNRIFCRKSPPLMQKCEIWEKHPRHVLSTARWLGCFFSRGLSTKDPKNPPTVACYCSLWHCVFWSISCYLTVGPSCLTRIRSLK